MVAGAGGVGANGRGESFWEVGFDGGVRGVLIQTVRLGFCFPGLKSETGGTHIWFGKISEI